MIDPSKLNPVEKRFYEFLTEKKFYDLLTPGKIKVKRSLKLILEESILQVFQKLSIKMLKTNRFFTLYLFSALIKLGFFFKLDKLINIDKIYERFNL
ncbi:MAG: hypothetical protein ACTSQJ_00435 [Promethearchaeota archaeon]